MASLRVPLGQLQSPPFRRGSLCLLLALVMVSLSSLASADIIHSNVNGTSVWFTNIKEGSPTGDTLPLYDQPISIQDVLVFTPTAGFAATSSADGLPDQTEGHLSLIIEAKPGQVIGGLKVDEAGVTRMTAPFGGNAFTSVLAYADIRVLEVGGVPVASPITSHIFSFAPNDSFLFSDLATGPTYATSWQGSLSVAFPANVTKIMLTVDNAMTASTIGAGTTALIDKNSFSIAVVPTGVVIPEPGTMMLGAIAFGGIFLTRKR